MWRGCGGRRVLGRECGEGVEEGEEGFGKGRERGEWVACIGCRMSKICNYPLD